MGVNEVFTSNELWFMQRGEAREPTHSSRRDLPPSRPTSPTSRLAPSESQPTSWLRKWQYSSLRARCSPNQEHRVSFGSDLLKEEKKTRVLTDFPTCTSAWKSAIGAIRARASTVLSDGFLRIPCLSMRRRALEKSSVAVRSRA